jgi:hypothetical protein
MRKFDKKKNIFEANLRLEANRLFEMIDLNEIADSKGYPYEILKDWGSNGYKVSFKVPKDENEITAIDPSTEWNMYITVDSRNKLGLENFILRIIDNDTETFNNLPDNIFGIEVSFGVIDEYDTTHYPELKGRRVLSIMGTVKAAINEFILRQLADNKQLLIIWSYPLSGGKDGYLREKLYNTYFDMEIKRSKMLSRFKKFNYGGYSGIYNADLLRPNDSVHTNVKTLDSKTWEVTIFKDGDEELYNKFWKYLDELNDNNTYPNLNVNFSEVNGRTYIYSSIRMLSKESVKTFLNKFREKFNAELKSDVNNGVKIKHGNKIISDVNDPYLNN